MAPLAVSPRVLRDLPGDQRRRWVVAAAATGVMLTSQGVAREDVDLTELPEGVREAIDRDASSSSFFGGPDQPLALGAPRPGVATAVGARPVAAAEEPQGTGALPDGEVEIARFGDVEIVTEGSRVELVGFHESSSAGALELDPAHPEVNADAAGGDDPVVVLPTRGRAGAPTSAVDLAMTPGETVPAPVSGEVIAVDDYRLYGSTSDVVIKIRSDADPSILVTVVHVVDPRVEAGDQVEAGTTPIAAEARQLPFESQIDRFTTEHRGAAAPHVHIELAQA